MTAQEKAKELVDKFQKGIDEFRQQPAPHDQVIECALICCDEIFEAFEKDDKEHQDCHNINSPTYRFYEKVKEEIQKL